jgi:hypothetical protein
MEKDLMKFQIDQLRKDKIIYACEACAVNLICILVFMFSNVYFSGLIKTIVDLLALVLGIFYTIYMGIGNSARLNKIKKLEKKI